MDLSITAVPVWVIISFIVAFSTYPIILITNAVVKAYKKTEKGNGLRIRNKVVLFYVLYFLTIAAFSLVGFFEKNVLPPRIIIFTAVPLLLFYLFYVQRLKWFKIVYENIKVEELIYIHLFRLVGVFFFLAYYYGAIPRAFAFIGGTGDIVTALLAIPVMIALKKSLSYAKLIAYIWSIIGLLDIISVIITAITLTKIALDTGGQGVQEFGTFPYSWIPAFAPATIIFLHILIFKKLAKA